jgi:hypothetical protein
MARKKKVTHEFKSRTRNGQREMICRNSIADESYFAWEQLKSLSRCKNFTSVSDNTTAVLCPTCTRKTVPPPEVRRGYVSKGRPRGWQFMKEFIDGDGNVFFKGVEQKNLKGTKAATKLEPKLPTRKLSKSEKDAMQQAILQQMNMVRGDVKKARFKKDIKSGQSQLKRLERQLKKIR